MLRPQAEAKGLAFTVDILGTACRPGSAPTASGCARS
jgi:hypothetical protein